MLTNLEFAVLLHNNGVGCSASVNKPILCSRQQKILVRESHIVNAWTQTPTMGTNLGR